MERKEKKREKRGIWKPVKQVDKSMVIIAKIGEEGLCVMWALGTHLPRIAKMFCVNGDSDLNTRVWYRKFCVHLCTLQLLLLEFQLLEDVSLWLTLEQTCIELRCHSYVWVGKLVPPHVLSQVCCWITGPPSQIGIFPTSENNFWITLISSAYTFCFSSPNRKCKILCKMQNGKSNMCMSVDKLFWDVRNENFQ